jgi:hypothetical protein
MAGLGRMVLDALFFCAFQHLTIPPDWWPFPTPAAEPPAPRPVTLTRAERRAWARIQADYDRS